MKKFFGDNLFAKIESNFSLILSNITTSFSHETLYVNIVLASFQKQGSRAAIIWQGFLKYIEAVYFSSYKFTCTINANSIVRISVDGF